MGLEVATPDEARDMLALKGGSLLVNPDLLARIKATGSIPTPFWTYVHYHGEKWAAYGDERMQRMFAHRSFLDHDIPVPGASDYTPGPFDPPHPAPSS